MATRAYANELLGASGSATADCPAAEDMGDTRCPLSNLDAFLASFSVTLAATGLPTWWITAIGLLLVLFGAILVHTGRRLRLRDR